MNKTIITDTDTIHRNKTQSEKNPAIVADRTGEDTSIENILRPKTFERYIGQEKTKENV